MASLKSHLQRFAQRFKNDPRHYFVAMTPVASGLLLGLSLSKWRLNKYLSEQIEQGYVEVKIEPKELEQAFKDMGLLLKKHGIETEDIVSSTRKESPNCSIRWNIGGVLKAFAESKEEEERRKNEEGKKEEGRLIHVREGKRGDAELEPSSQEVHSAIESS
ncbi:uncharacterized protein EAE98_006243 [Botrytis deweyae]|uniref:Uncharacterized protein n=1 Tax=Botrytis deweyae TaxID=2478750 RepID=A0ABQ7IL44_9HELO|nr:uncharacterized protein EAE98_006243 [Botrytis deweyae]KAF7926859.1 hypothetical protein EAE98_006243 [Botrytis deweyae]